MHRAHNSLQIQNSSRLRQSAMSPKMAARTPQTLAVLSVLPMGTFSGYWTHDPDAESRYWNSPALPPPVPNKVGPNSINSQLWAAKMEKASPAAVMQMTVILKIRERSDRIRLLDERIVKASLGLFAVCLLCSRDQDTVM